MLPPTRASVVGFSPINNSTSMGLISGFRTGISTACNGGDVFYRAGIVLMTGVPYFPI